MPDFKNLYREIYRTFGYPLSKATALSGGVLRTQEKRLGIRLPAALRDYYLIAGHERRFSRCHNRLLAPAKWTLDKQRLIFMEENQCVVRWGVSIRNQNAADPPVSQGVGDDEIAWYPEHRKCSVFLAVMLHFQAVNGGMPFCGSADVPDNTDYRFEKRGWTHRGEVNGLQAYSRKNHVICLMPPASAAPWAQKWTVLVGAKTNRDRKAIGAELGVRFD